MADPSLLHPSTARPMATPRYLLLPPRALPEQALLLSPGEKLWQPYWEVVPAMARQPRSPRERYTYLLIRSSTANLLKSFCIRTRPNARFAS